MARAFVADIGGTHLKFALCEGGRLISGITTVPCAEFADPIGAISSASHAAGLDHLPRIGAVAAAGPVIDGAVSMTNLGWTLRSEELRSALDLDDFELVNDLSAWACALPHLSSEQAQRFAAGPPLAGGTKAVLAAGTGLGIAGLLASPDGWFPVPGEGGHVSFAPANDGEIEILRSLARQFGHVSVERLLSGQGLVNLYRALKSVGDQPCRLDDSRLTPETVADAAQTRSCPTAVATAQCFSAILGAVAGDVALTLGARGGVYIGGGAVRGLGPAFDKTAFHERFVEKGRFAVYLGDIPCFIIETTDAALVGLAAALTEI